MATFMEPLFRFVHGFSVLVGLLSLPIHTKDATPFCRTHGVTWAMQGVMLAPSTHSACTTHMHDHPTNVSQTQTHFMAAEENLSISKACHPSTTWVWA